MNLTLTHISVFAKRRPGGKWIWLRVKTSVGFQKDGVQVKKFSPEMKQETVFGLVERRWSNRMDSFKILAFQLDKVYLQDRVDAF